MPKFTKNDKHLFAKGGRNKGRPEDVLEARKMNRAEVEAILQKISLMSPDDLEVYAADPSRVMLELFVISIYRKGVKEGDTHRMNFLLDRMVGPVPKVVDATIKDKGKSQRVLDAVEQLKVLIYAKEKRK